MNIPLPQRWRRRLRSLSKIWIRLLAFNGLLVFLPATGLVVLSNYEEDLLASQEIAMSQEGRLLVASLEARLREGDWATSPGLGESARRILLSLQQRSPSRLQVVDADGQILADSAALGPRQEPGGLGVSKLESDYLRPEGRESWVYRLGSSLYRFATGGWRGQDGRDERQESPLAQRREVRSVLEGSTYSAGIRPTPGQRSLTLSSALPIYRADGSVAGAVVVSRSTFSILQDLYQLRLAFFQVVLVSVLAAVVLSLLVATTIARPLDRLRRQAEQVVDRRGRLRGRFGGSDKLDEIGDLSRSLQQLTDRLEGHVRFIESFAEELSHELKNPLASVRTAAETAATLHGDDPEDAQQRQIFLERIQRQVARMEHLLTGARELTRLDAQLEHEERGPLDLRPLLRDLVEGYRMRLGDADATAGGRRRLRWETTGEPLWVHAAPERIAQVLENLLDNALTCSPDERPVRLQAERVGASVRLTVRDHGPGIPEGHLSRIFQRFFSYRPDAPQAGNHRTSGHAGLGLAVVKAIVEGYGGTVTATNARDGGALFQVLLPALEPPTAT
ncbi:MAG: ATP-binding protein [Acidobacteriota bacterium]